jgi:hypothetical protein
MIYAIQMDSGVMIYLHTFIKIGTHYTNIKFLHQQFEMSYVGIIIGEVMM